MYFRHAHYPRAIALASVLFFLGCPKASESATSKGTPTKSTPTTVSAPTNAKPVFTNFPAISVDGLTPDQLSTFTKLANEEICPCSCPKTFAGCLQSAEHCKPAQILGQWIVEKMREGVPVDMMLEPISREIGEGYEAAPQIIDIEGYFSKGAKNPKYTIVEFADFECPHCKATASVLDDFVNRNSNTVKLVYKYFPLNPSPTSKMAALAVEAAGKQGKFWQMHDAAFRSTTMLTEDLLLGHAKAIGLKIDQFKKDMNDKEVRMKVERSLQEALRLGLKGTPSIFFNGRPYHLSLDRSGIDMRLAMESARNDSSCK